MLHLQQIGEKLMELEHHWVDCIMHACWQQGQTYSDAQMMKNHEKIDTQKCMIINSIMKSQWLAATTPHWHHQLSTRDDHFSNYLLKISVKHVYRTLSHEFVSHFCNQQKDCGQAKFQETVLNKKAKWRPHSSCNKLVSVSFISI